METIKQKRKRKTYLKPSEIDCWSIDVVLTNHLDKTKTKFNFSEYGNPDGLAQSLKSHITFYYYNYYKNILLSPDKVKYKHMIYPDLFFTGCNMRILNSKSDVKNSIIDEACLSSLLLTKEQRTDKNLHNDKLIMSKATAKKLKELNELIAQGKIILED